MQIWAHTLVKNEENYLWFAVMSIVNHVDKILLWDTGSTDNTIEIIKLLKKEYPKKIDYKQFGDVDINEFTSVRQQMLEKTDSDWFIIVDGDEVWWEDSIKEHIDLIKSKGKSIDSIVTPYKNIIGDIYHYQDESAGNYRIDGKKGHLTIRVMNRNIPGLHLAKPHGTQGFFDKDNVLVQELDKDKRVHLKDGYLHFTHMQRSMTSDSKVPKRQQKFKFEIGNEFPLDYYYPEVFFKSRPNFVKSPWFTMDRSYKIKSSYYLPIKRVKRLFFISKDGY